MYTLLGCIKHKCRDSYVLYIPTVHAFSLVLLTHTLLVQTHTHDVSAPWLLCLANKESSGDIFIIFLQGGKNKSYYTKWGLKILRMSIVRIPLLIMTNGIRKVRLGVDIFRQKKS